MILCPIAHWKKQRPRKQALGSLTYEELDALVGKLAYCLNQIPENLLAFIPKPEPLSIALFFATWRAKKTIYPLSHRLPEKSVLERLQKTGTHFIDPASFSQTSSYLETDLDPNQTATLLETSGTTKEPKIVCHALKSHFVSAQAAIEALKLSETSYYCLNLPLHHISGLALTLRTFLSGATLLLPGESALATHISMVPTQLHRYIENEESLPNLECLLIGGAPLPQSLHQKALEKSIPLYISYGMTECSAMAILNGKTLPHIECKLSDEKEILLRGASLLQNYWGLEKRKETDWFATKDLGRFAHDGLLEILGRNDRQFISGGENIQPEEIERALLSLPHILTAHVFSIKDPEFGMIPKAEIIITKQVSSEEIQKQLEEFLPRFKIPKEIQTICKQ